MEPKVEELSDAYEGKAVFLKAGLHHNVLATSHLMSHHGKS